MTFVSSNAQCFFVNDTQLLGVIYITDLNFFHEIHFYICMKMFAIFLLYISIKNKTSVFYAFPFSHGPRRGVSGRGTCVISLTVWHVWGNRRLAPGALWRENSRAFVSVSLHSFLRFQRPRRSSWWRIHVYISAANHGSVNFSEHRKSSNLDLKQGFSWLHVLNWSSLSEWTYT